MQKLRVDIWSDIACPWCYIGKRRLEAALLQFPERSQVEVVWHSFELDPAAPRERDNSQSHAQRLAKKYGFSVAEAEARTAQLSAVAQSDGLNFDFKRIRSGNTFDAHRLLHLAAESSQQDAVKERLFRAYLSEGQAIGDPETLQRLATEAGLPEAAVRGVLSSDRYAAEVRADEQQARELGISGVPFFVFDERLAVSGAQPAAVLLSALQQAVSTRTNEAEAFSEGAVCGPDGC